MSNKVLILLFLLFNLVLLSSCGKQAEIKEKVETSEEILDKAKENSKLNLDKIDQRPELDESRDYTNDISGNWSWKVVKDNQIVGEGIFRLKENKKSISGLNVMYVTDIEAIPGLGGNPDLYAMISRKEIKGRRDGDVIKFEIFDKDGNNLSGVKNSAKIINKGHTLKGKTIQEGIVNSEKVKIEYTWKAERVTG